MLSARLSYWQRRCCSAGPASAQQYHHPIRSTPGHDRVGLASIRRCLDRDPNRVGCMIHGQY